MQKRAGKRTAKYYADRYEEFAESFRVLMGNDFFDWPTQIPQTHETSEARFARLTGKAFANVFKDLLKQYRAMTNQDFLETGYVHLPTHEEEHLMSDREFIASILLDMSSLATRLRSGHYEVWRDWPSSWLEWPELANKDEGTIMQTLHYYSELHSTLTDIQSKLHWENPIYQALEAALRLALTGQMHAETELHAIYDQLVRDYYREKAREGP